MGSRRQSAASASASSRAASAAFPFAVPFNGKRSPTAETATQPVRRFDLVDKPHSLAAQYRQVDRFAVGRAGNSLDGRPERRGYVGSGDTSESQQTLAQCEAAVRIDTNQPHLDQADQQASSRRFGQPQPLAEID